MARLRKRNPIRRTADWFSRQISLWRQMREDSKCLDKFIDAIEEQCSDRESAFSKANLKPGEDGESLVLVTGVSQEVQTNGQDYLIQDKLDENTFFVTEMIKQETGLNDYILKPDYYHVEDPTNDRTVSLTYLAVWTFSPLVSESEKKSLLTKIYSAGAAIAAGLGWLAFILI